MFIVSCLSLQTVYIQFILISHKSIPIYLLQSPYIAKMN